MQRQNEKLQISSKTTHTERETHS